jgi:hypothetical protein
MSQVIYLDWNDDRIGNWDDNPFNWEFVALIIEDTGGKSPDDYLGGAKKKKKRNKIKLTVFIDGKEITETKEPKQSPVVFIRDVNFKGSNKDIVIEVKDIQNV